MAKRPLRGVGTRGARVALRALVVLGVLLLAGSSQAADGSETLPAPAPDDAWFVDPLVGGRWVVR